MPGPVHALRHRSRRVRSRRSSSTLAWRPRSMRTSAAMTPRGRLLGPDAVDAAVEEFRRLGAEVIVRPSPWRLGAAETGLAVEWLTGWVGAACEQEPGLAADADLYRRRRRRRGGGRSARRHGRPRRPVGAAVRSHLLVGCVSRPRRPRSPPSSGVSAPVRSSTACARSTAVLFWRRRPSVSSPPSAVPGGGRSLPAASVSACRCPPPSRPTTARCSSTSRSRAASPETSIAASATGATCTTSAAPCGPSPGSALPDRSCRHC